MILPHNIIINYVRNSTTIINAKVKVDYVVTRKELKEVCSISNLANYLLGIKEISTADVTITRSIEREVRKRIYCEEVKEKKCIGKIYGRPDFMIDGIPGEIKATSSNNEAELLRKGIVQRVLRVDVKGEVSQEDIRNFMDYLSSVSVKGYPYPLLKAHYDVKVKREDINRILNLFHLNKKSSWWPSQFY